MRAMQQKMAPGGIQPDQLGAEGGGQDVQALLDAIETAPPDVLQLIKEAVDAKLASSSSPQQDGLGGQG